jgi:hypothetical protein
MSFHIWESPDGRRVLFTRRVVRDLRARAIESFLALPRRGIEIGGVLFGEAAGEDLQIAGFEESPCEHRYGPSFALSANDRKKLDELLAHRGDGPRVIGYFQSFASREPSIEEADEAFVRDHFPTGDFAYLMLEPLTADECVARFRFFRDGQLLPEMEEPPFAFDFRQMPAAEVPSEPAAFTEATTARQPLEETPAPAPNGSGRAEEFEPEPGRWSPAAEPARTSATLSAAATARQLAGDETYRWTEEPQPLTTAPPISVAEPASEAPKLTAAPAAETPRRTADSQLKSVVLPAVLPERRSAVSRWAEEPERRTSRGWMAAAVCLAIALGSAGVYKLWSMATAPRWMELHLDARRVGSQLVVTWDGNAPGALDGTRGLLAVREKDAHREIPLDARQLREGTYTYVPFHGDVELRLILYRKGLGVAGDALRVEAIPEPVPASEVLTPDAADRSATPQEPPSQPATARAVSGPSAVHEVQPPIPEGIRSRITDRIVIPVEVEVSAQGRVTRATPETQAGDGLRRYLGEQAQRAARQWRFTPARTKDGERVAARTTVQFVFTP